MMKTNPTQNPSFGWKGKTHYHITSAISERLPATRQYSRLLGFSSVIPDWSMSKCWAGFKGPHLYFGEEFLSYDTIPQNASDFYFNYLSKALFYLRTGNNKIGMYHAGIALHFLQDTTCPLHTKKEYLKLGKILTHKRYEGLAKKQTPFIDKFVTSTTQIENVNFDDCYKTAYQKSSSMRDPHKLKNNELTSHIREGLQNACIHTFQFLERLSKLTNVPLNKQEEIFTKEAVESFKL